MWKLEGSETNNYLATAPNATVTGFGADLCFPAGTMIKTLFGDVAIERLTRENLLPILTYNHKFGTIELENIVANRRLKKMSLLQSRLTKEIVCDAQQTIEFTQKTRDILEQMNLKSEIPSFPFCLMECDHCKKIYTIPQYAFNKIEKKVRKRIFVAKLACVLRTTKKDSKRDIAQYVKKVLHKNDIYCSRECKEKFVAERLIKNRESKEIKCKECGAMFYPINWKSKFCSMECKKCKPFKKYDRRKKFQLHKRIELFKRIPSFKANSHRKISEQVRYVQCRGIYNKVCKSRNCQTENVFNCASQRQQQTKQLFGKSSFSLQHVPCYNTQDEQITEIIVSRGEEYVYDIQTEINHNFFANNILVHNCIIDDIVKNAYEANHQGILEGHFDWFTNTMYSRLEGRAKVILIMTRWSTKDLAGRLMKLYDENNRKYKLVVKKHLKKARHLNPDILDKKRYDDLVNTIGADIVQANYNQEPMDLVGFLYGGFQTYKTMPNEIGKIKSMCDTADTGSDFLCNIIYKEIGKTAYVIDIYYTQDNIDKTEKELPKRLVENKVDWFVSESNFGGSAFRKIIKAGCIALGKEDMSFKGFSQTQNKEGSYIQ